ncbi:MAG TPA: hypothetical protein VN421_01230, partial [Pseudoflavonifractor sp.]|nr:hypothetical protein [Pseudoflavonifractor sp.]
MDLIVNRGLTVAGIDWRSGEVAVERDRRVSDSAARGAAQIPDFETFNIFWSPFRHKERPQSGVIVRTGGVAMVPIILSGDHNITYFTASKMK